MIYDKKSLFLGRSLLMIPEVKLTAEQSATLAEMSKWYPKTARSYRIVARLDDFYSSRSMEEAQTAFERLYSWMRHCRLQPMKVAAGTLMHHKDKIIAYFEAPPDKRYWRVAEFHDSGG